MDRAAVSEQIAKELAHIPWWPGDYQGLLRAVYQLLRANDLRARRVANARVILQRSIAVIWRDYPTAQIAYDRAFFHG